MNLKQLLLSELTLKGLIDLHIQTGWAIFLRLWYVPVILIVLVIWAWFIC